MTSCLIWILLLDDMTLDLGFLTSGFNGQSNEAGGFLKRKLTCEFKKNI
ncbi:MAG: hypothetical protein R2875_13045 [Desulfobacterales bacterium]